MLGEGPSDHPVSVRVLRMEGRNEATTRRGTFDPGFSMPPPTSSWVWIALIALSMKSVPYETPEDEGGIEALSEKSTTNTPMQRRTPTLD